jgi:hypothetical protein
VQKDILHCELHSEESLALFKYYQPYNRCSAAKNDSLRLVRLIAKGGKSPIIGGKSPSTGGQSPIVGGQCPII